MREHFRMVQSHAVRGAAAAIVAHERELFKTQVLHHFHLVLRHGPLRVGEVISSPGGLAAISVAAQIRHHQEIILRQRRRNLAPEHVRFGNAMQEQQRRAFFIAAVNCIDRRSRSFDLLALEAGEKFRARLLRRLPARQAGPARAARFPAAGASASAIEFFRNSRRPGFGIGRLQWMNIGMNAGS